MDKIQQIDKIKDMFDKNFDKHLVQPKIYDYDSLDCVCFEWDLKSQDVDFEILWMVDLQSGEGDFDIENLNQFENGFYTKTLSAFEPIDWKWVNTEIEWYSL